ncbi:MAG: NAD-dependent epimerase/dehydratase family protein [Cellulomonas sp.]
MLSPPGPGDVVLVVGRGAVAAAIGTWFARPDETGEPTWNVRALEEVPAVAPQAALAGVAVVVLVLHDGDFAGYVRTPMAERRSVGVAHTQRTLAASRAVGVRHLVVISSAMVYGAVPDQAVITDAAPAMTTADGVVGDLLAVEAVLERGRRRRTPVVTVLRPAALVGLGIDTIITRHFEAPRLLTVRGSTREWQFAHVEDLASAAEHAVRHGLAGALTVGAGDALSPTQVEAASGLRRIELAAVTAFGTAERLHRVGVLPTPSSELAYTVYSWTVASDRLRAGGWEPSWSSAACLEVLLASGSGRLAVAGRRVGPRDAAALGAAGAAVAFLGTAAVWRQARGRRRG